MKTTLILVLCVAAYTSAYICCPGPSLTGSNEMIIHSRGGFYDPKSKYAVEMTTATSVHYDAVHYKYALIQTTDAGGYRTHFKAITDFQQQVQYTILDDKCTKTAAQNPYDLCIPDDAVVLGRYEYAMGKVKGTEYKYNATLFGAKTTMIVTMTDDCIPFAVSTVTETEAGIMVSSGNYANITLGIKDPSVFNVPSICFHDNVVPDVHVDVNDENEVVNRIVQQRPKVDEF